MAFLSQLFLLKVSIIQSVFNIAKHSLCSVAAVNLFHLPIRALSLFNGYSAFILSPFLRFAHAFLIPQIN